jgi:hypothetical protein
MGLEHLLVPVHDLRTFRNTYAEALRAECMDEPDYADLGHYFDVSGRYHELCWDFGLSVLLGVAEAGFWPGVLYHLSF